MLPALHELVLGQGPSPRPRAVPTGARKSTAANGVSKRTVLTALLGKRFMQDVHEIYSVKRDATGTGTVVRYGLIDLVPQLLTLTSEFRTACMLYFARPFLLAMDNLSNLALAALWRREKDGAIKLFYDFPSMSAAHEDLRGMCATDTCRLLEALHNAPPRKYVIEYLGSPWYFRSFMRAFELMEPAWRTGGAFRLSFEEFSKLCFRDMGWDFQPHDASYTSGLAAFSTCESCALTFTDLHQLRERFVHSRASLCHVTPERYYELFEEYRSSGNVPPDMPFDAPRMPGAAWVVFMIRDPAEKPAVLATLERLWATYTRERTTEALVDLIQTFNGNHYFRDGNGRFSMLLIQLHMHATTGRFIYLWNHNPNGPCLAKYARMLDLAIPVPNQAPYEVAHDRIRQAYEAAMQVSCSRRAQVPLPDLPSGEVNFAAMDDEDDDDDDDGVEDEDEMEY